MKKHMLLILSYFVLSQVDCCAYPGDTKSHDSINDNSFNESLPHFTNHINQRLENVTEYFKNEMMNPDKKMSVPLININGIFDFPVFSRGFLERNPYANNNLIIFRFVQGCAQSMINSEEYSWENTEMFNLVEALDPVCRYYRHHSQNS